MERTIAENAINEALNPPEQELPLIERDKRLISASELRDRRSFKNLGYCND